MIEVELTYEQHEAAKTLKEGPVVYSYLDNHAVRMETREGVDPYVWHGDKWVPMRGTTW